MSKQIEALKLALEALVKTDAEPGSKAWEREAEAITAIREALAEQCVCGEPNTPGTHRTDGPCYAEQAAQQQEPVAWRYKKEGGGWFVSDNEPQYVEQWNDIEEIQPLYTSPPASKPWVGLTDEEIADIEIAWEATREWACFRYAARAIEAKLKDKNK